MAARCPSPLSSAQSSAFAWQCVPGLCQITVQMALRLLDSAVALLVFDKLIRMACLTGVGSQTVHLFMPNLTFQAHTLRF